MPKGEIQDEVEHFTENKFEQFARNDDVCYMQAVREVPVFCSVGTMTEGFRGSPWSLLLDTVNLLKPRGFFTYHQA